MIKPTKLPFEGTKADPDHTKIEIVNLLKKFGIEDYQWTEEMGQPTLAFKTDVKIDEHVRFYQVIIKPALPAKEFYVFDEHTRMRVKKAIPMYAQGYRILLNYLKAKLTNISLGVVKFEEEFLADIAINTDQGKMRLIDVLKARNPGLLGLPNKTVDLPEEVPRE